MLCLEVLTTADAAMSLLPMSRSYDESVTPYVVKHKRKSHLRFSRGDCMPSRACCPRVQPLVGCGQLRLECSLMVPAKGIVTDVIVCFRAAGITICGGKRARGAFCVSLSRHKCRAQDARECIPGSRHEEQAFAWRQPAKEGSPTMIMG